MDVVGVERGKDRMCRSVQRLAVVGIPVVLLVTACELQEDAERGSFQRNRDEAPLTPPPSRPFPSSCDAFDDQGALGCTYSGLTARERQVIRDEISWAAIWDQAMSRHSEPPALPPVDFSREMVLFAAMGGRPSGGFTIVVEDVAYQGGRLDVTIAESSPGRFCVVTTALTQPFTAVRVARTEGEVNFVERQVTDECAH